MSRTHHARRPRGGYWSLSNWVYNPDTQEIVNLGPKYRRYHGPSNYKPSAEWRQSFMRAKDGVAKQEIEEQLAEHKLDVRERFAQHIPTCPAYITKVHVAIPVKHLACYRPFRIGAA